MAHTIEITVQASLRDSDLIFRILNFKEDIHRTLLKGGYGTVADPSAMDRALAPVTITISRKRHFDIVLKSVSEALRCHNVSDAIHFTARAL